MKLLVLAVLLTASYALAGPRSQKSQQQKDVSDYQTEVLKLYQGLGSEDTHDFVRKEFPYTDAKYYREPSVVDKFVQAYNEGFLDKEGYFSLYSYKNRHDTYRLFDIFYFAKDFDTFIKIAKWAKHELNPLQFTYAFTAAVYQRKDTQGVIPPPFYEVLPTYFTPSHVMYSAYKAMIQDVKYSKFEVNGTGYDYSWYKGVTFDKYKYSPKYNEYDVESRISYYREDVGVNDWFSKFFLRVAPFLSDEKYPDLTWERRGEYIYMIMKFVLYKYNLERYANGLPPVEPINFHKYYKTGYNPELSNVYGHPFVSRPDGHHPFYTNPTGVDYLDNMYSRYLGQVDSQAMFTPNNASMVSIEGREGFENFVQTFFGIAHPTVRKYYRPLYYQAMETFDVSVKSANDVGYSGSVLGHFLTESRDPAFYSVLAYLNKLFYAYDAKKTPYTKKDIDFPGVKINSFDFSKLETFFERYEYDISNGIPYKGDVGKFKYLASKWRLNHKPFSYTINIQSDKEVEAMVKVYLAPKYDSNNREYGFSAFPKYGLAYDIFYVTLKAGTNTFERKPHQFYYQETPRLKHIIEKLQRAKSSGTPFGYDKEFIGSYPANLALPRGSKDGTVFQAFAIVAPKGSSSSNKNTQDQQIYQDYDTEMFMNYPFDRPVYESVFHTYNTYFKDITIYDVTNYAKAH